MLSRRRIAWLFFPLAALACRLVLAEGLQTPRGVLHSQQRGVLPAAHWDREAAPSPPPLPELTLEEPEAIATPAPAVPLHSDSSARLTLDDLEQIALESNPTLVQARMAVRAAEGDFVQASLYPNPTIGYAGADVGLDGTSGQQGAVLGQEIVTSGKLRLERAVASHEVRKAQYGWEAQRLRVFNDVRAGYYEVLLGQKMIDLNLRLVGIGDEGLRLTEQLRAAEEVSRAEVLQVTIEAEKARLSLAEARTHHQTAWRRLAAVLGRPDLEPAPLAGDIEVGLPEFNWEDSLAQLLAQSPELGQARAGVQRERYVLARQSAERVPNLEIEVGAKYDETALRTLADVGLTLPLPLFNRNQGNIIRAQAELITAQREVDRVELDLRDRLAAAFEQYANARRQVDAYSSSILPNAKESWDLISLGRREGEFGYLTLLTAQRTYFSVNLDYLAHLRALWAQSVELEGMLLSGGLQGPE